MSKSERLVAPAGSSAESVLITGALAGRPSRTPDFAEENDALRALAHKLSHSPKEAMRELVSQALVLCRADSAGICLAEMEGEEEVFRWQAVAGRLKPFLNYSMPRHFSPSGEAVSRRSTLLMQDIERHYQYVKALHIPISELLLVPLFRAEEAIGTVWVVKHDSSSQFDAEDKRLLESLAAFTSGVTASYFNMHKLEELITSLNNERDQRDRFVATLTHDLRTPLTATRLSAQLLLKKLPATGERSKLEQIVKGMDRAERMIRDLLDSSRIQSGEGLPLYKGDCHLDRVAEAAVRDLTLIYGPRFRVLAPAVAMQAHCDEDGIQRIIENLGSNAAKYGDPDKPITIKLEKKGDRAVISVQNEGKPIHSAEQAAIFRPYRRTGDAEAAGQKGWGIGLALVKGITEAHGGNVTLLSDVAGTTFQVSIPI